MKGRVSEQERQLLRHGEWAEKRGLAARDAARAIHVFKRD